MRLHGSYLASRFDGVAGFNLYPCPDEGRGFIIEVGLTENKPLVVRNFAHSEALIAYTPSFWLPEV